MEQEGQARKREGQSCIYGTMRSSRTNIMRMKLKLLARDRNSQLMTMTDSNDIFTHTCQWYLQILLVTLKAFQTTEGINTSWLGPRTTCQVNTLF